MNLRLRFLFLLPAILLCCAYTSFCFTWNSALGGGYQDYGSVVIQTMDGGYLVSGYTQSFGSVGPWIIKFDGVGNVQWQKIFHAGASTIDQIFSVQQTQDGGFVAVGSTSGANYFRGWVLRIDGGGNVLWQRQYADKSHSVDAFYSVNQTRDGGYVVAGVTTFFSPRYNFWVLKLDNGGKIQWKKAYGGQGGDIGIIVQQTSDDGYVVGGMTRSFGIVGNGFDFWVLKLDRSGQVEWQRAYGGLGDDILASLEQTQDGGYIMGGSTNSFGAGGDDCWLIKIDTAGNIQWQRTYGKGPQDGLGSVQQTRDGGYIVAALTFSYTRMGNALVFKTSADGNLEWKRIYGGTRGSYANLAAQTTDEGYIVAGAITSPQRGSDSWVLKLDGNGNAALSCDDLSANVDIRTQQTFAKITITKAKVATTPASVTSLMPEVLSTFAKAYRLCSPFLKSMTPEYGSVGDPVVLTGGGFGAPRSGSQVFIGFAQNWAQAKILSWSNTMIKMVIPPEANTGPVNILPDGLSSAVGASRELTVMPIPPARLRPAAGLRSGGTRVAVQLPVDASKDGLQVQFGGLAADDVRVVLPSLIVCTAPPAKHPGSVEVTVTTGGTTLTVGNFTYQ